MRRLQEGDFVTVIELGAVVDSYESLSFIVPYKNAYRKLIESLLSNERRRGMRTKNLYDNLFSLSVTKSVRILAIRYYSERHCYWVIADLETDHDRYERKIPNFNFLPALKALRRLVSKREKLKEKGEGGVADQYLYPESRNPDLEAQYQAIKRSAAKYRNQVVRTSEEQQVILEELQAKLTREKYLSLVTGPAGSGKSFLAFMLLKWLTEQGIPAIFMASSKKLRVEQRKDWLLSLAPDIDEDMVSFFGYVEFLKDIDLVQDDPLVPGGLRVPMPDGQYLKVVGDDHLREYYLEAQKKDKRRGRKNRKINRAVGVSSAANVDGSPNSLNDVAFEVFKQEFSIMLGEKECYLSSGSSDSLYYDNEDLKLALWDAFEEYKNKLNSEQSCHLSFFEFKPDEPCCRRAVLLDECFDLNRFELTSLMNTCYRLVVKGDLNQALGDTSNLMGFAELEMKLRGGETYTLIGTHRSRKNIASAGTSILDYKKKLKLRRPSGVLKVASLLPDYGWIKFDRELIFKQEWYVGLSTAVICHESEAQRVKDVCKTPLVFTVEEIKGLGYPRIVILNLLSPSSNISRVTAKTFLSLLEKKGVSRGSIQSKDHAVLAKTHALYTAIMRGEVEVVFVNEGSKKSHDQMIPFEERIKQTVVQPGAREPGVINRLNVIDYLRERRRLRESGNSSQADDVDAKIKEKLFLSYKVGYESFPICISSPTNADLTKFRDLSIETVRSKFKLKHLLGFLWANLHEVELDLSLAIEVFLKLKPAFLIQRVSYKLNDALHDVSEVSLAGIIFKPGNSRQLMDEHIPLFKLTSDSRGAEVLNHWLDVYLKSEGYNFRESLSKKGLSSVRQQGAMRGSTFLHGLTQYGSEFLDSCRVIAHKVQSFESDPKSSDERNRMSEVSSWFSEIFDANYMLIKSSAKKSLHKTPWGLLLDNNSGCRFLRGLMESHVKIFEKLMTAFLEEALKKENIDAAWESFNALCDAEYGKVVLENWFSGEFSSTYLLVQFSVQLILIDSSRSKLLLSIYSFPGVYSMYFKQLEENQESPEVLKPLLEVLVSNSGMFLMFAKSEVSLKYLYRAHEEFGCEAHVYARLRDWFYNQEDCYSYLVNMLNDRGGQVILSAWAKKEPETFAEYVNCHFLKDLFQGLPLLLVLHKTEQGHSLLRNWRNANIDFNAHAVAIISSNPEWVKMLLCSEEGILTLSACFTSDLASQPNLFIYLKLALDKFRPSVIKVVNQAFDSIISFVTSLENNKTQSYIEMLSFFKALEPDHKFSGIDQEEDPIICILLMLGSTSRLLRDKVLATLRPLVKKIDAPFQKNNLAKKVVSYLISQVVVSQGAHLRYVCSQLYLLQELPFSESVTDQFVELLTLLESEYKFFSDEVLVALANHNVTKAFFDIYFTVNSIRMIRGEDAKNVNDKVSNDLKFTLRERMSESLKGVMAILELKSNFPVNERLLPSRQLQLLKSVCHLFLYTSIEDDSFFYAKRIIRKDNYYRDCLRTLSDILLESSAASRGDVSDELIIQVILLLSNDEKAKKELISNKKLISIMLSYALDEESIKDSKIPFLSEGEVFYSRCTPRHKLLSFVHSLQYRETVIQSLDVSRLIDRSLIENRGGFYAKDVLSNLAESARAYHNAEGPIGELIELLDSSYVLVQECALRALKRQISSVQRGELILSDTLVRRAYDNLYDILKDSSDEAKSLALELFRSLLRSFKSMRDVTLERSQLLSLIFEAYNDQEELIFELCSNLAVNKSFLIACLKLESFQRMVSKFFYSSRITFALQLIAYFLSTQVDGKEGLLNKFNQQLFECLPKERGKLIAQQKEKQTQNQREEYFSFRQLSSKELRGMPTFNARYWVDCKKFLDIMLYFFLKEINSGKMSSVYIVKLKQFIIGFHNIVRHKSFTDGPDFIVRLRFLTFMLALQKNKQLLEEVLSTLRIDVYFQWASSITLLRNRSLALLSVLVFQMLPSSDLKPFFKYGNKRFQESVYLPYLENANEFLHGRLIQVVNILVRLVRKLGLDIGPGKMSLDTRFLFLLYHPDVISDIKIFIMDDLCNRPSALNYISSNPSGKFNILSVLFDFLLGDDYSLKSRSIKLLSGVYPVQAFHALLASESSLKELLEGLVSLKVSRLAPIREEAKMRLDQLSAKQPKKGVSRLESPSLVNNSISQADSDLKLNAEATSNLQIRANLKVFPKAEASSLSKHSRKSNARLSSKTGKSKPKPKRAAKAKSSSRQPSMFDEYAKVYGKKKRNQSKKTSSPKRSQRNAF